MRRRLFARSREDKIPGGKESFLSAGEAMDKQEELFAWMRMQENAMGLATYLFFLAASLCSSWPSLHTRISLSASHSQRAPRGHAANIVRPGRSRVLATDRPFVRTNIPCSTMDQLQSLVDGFIVRFSLGHSGFT